MRIHRYVEGILWMVATNFWNSLNVAVTRYLTAVIPTFQLLFFSYLFSLIVMIPVIVRTGVARLRTKRWRLFALRAALEVAGAFCMVRALTLLPLPVFSALALVTPLLTSFLAVVVLREQGTWRTWLTLLTGLAGALIVIRPGAEAFDYGYGALLMLGSSLCFSQCGIIIRKLSETEPPFVVTFYMFLFAAIFSLPLALSVWKTPGPETLPWLFLLGMFLSLVQFCVASAFTRAPLTVVLPFSFMFLVFSSIVAYVAFDELVDLWTVAGAAVILASAVYAARHHVRNAHVKDRAP